MEPNLQIQLFNIYFQSKFCTRLGAFSFYWNASLEEKMMGWKPAGPAGAAKSQMQQIFSLMLCYSIIDKDYCSWRIFFCLNY